eukprot:TRINITY_DN7614_c0_g1_i1.p1 TRINITY_DN7614_c0_g1~~TRINITY_DN7614_c0_g1_i1.p1  ORF type:complete len:1045 (+),score=123.79 TRINITY_DN7614_c0_g1_i1:37-3135(+)
MRSLFARASVLFKERKPTCVVSLSGDSLHVKFDTVLSPTFASYLFKCGASYKSTLPAERGGPTRSFWTAPVALATTVMDCLFAAARNFKAPDAQSQCAPGERPVRFLVSPDIPKLTFQRRSLERLSIAGGLLRQYTCGCRPPENATSQPDDVDYTPFICPSCSQGHLGLLQSDPVLFKQRASQRLCRRVTRKISKRRCKPRAKKSNKVRKCRTHSRACRVKPGASRVKPARDPVLGRLPFAFTTSRPARSTTSLWRVVLRVFNDNVNGTVMTVCDPENATNGAQHPHGDDYICPAVGDRVFVPLSVLPAELLQTRSSDRQPAQKACSRSLAAQREAVDLEALVSPHRLSYTGRLTQDAQQQKFYCVQCTRLIQTHMNTGASHHTLRLPGFARPLWPSQEAMVTYALVAKQMIVADDMGLGKTTAALAALTAQGAFPALVFCPANLEYQWVQEIMKCLPTRTVYAASSTPKALEFFRRSSVDNMPDIVLISLTRAAALWRALMLEHAAVEMPNKDKAATTPRVCHLFRGVIVDEAHKVLNMRSVSSTAVAGFMQSTTARLLLTGTPVINSPRDMFGMLHLLPRHQHLMRSLRVLQARSSQSLADAAQSSAKKDEDDKEESSVRVEHLEIFQQVLRQNAMIRRTKEVVMQLPGKARRIERLRLANQATYDEVEHNITIETASAFVKAAEAVCEQSSSHATNSTSGAPTDAEYVSPLSIARATSRVRFQVMQSCQQLRRLSSLGKVPAVVALVNTLLSEDPSAPQRFAHSFMPATQLRDAVEWDPVFSSVSSAAGGPRKVVVMTNFVEPAMQLANELGTCVIHGGVAKSTRQDILRSFRSDAKSRVLVSTMMTSGVGIDLSVADVLIVMDFPWTIASLLQAEDRLYRFGQRRGVRVFYMVAPKSIDATFIPLLLAKETICGAMVASKKDDPPGASDSRLAKKGNFAQLMTTSGVKFGPQVRDRIAEIVTWKSPAIGNTAFLILEKSSKGGRSVNLLGRASAEEKKDVPTANRLFSPKEVSAGVWNNPSLSFSMPV